MRRPGELDALRRAEAGFSEAPEASAAAERPCGNAATVGISHHDRRACVTGCGTARGVIHTAPAVPPERGAQAEHQRRGAVVGRARHRHAHREAREHTERRAEQRPPVRRRGAVASPREGHAEDIQTACPPRRPPYQTRAALRSPLELSAIGNPSAVPASAPVAAPDRPITQGLASCTGCTTCCAAACEGTSDSATPMPTNPIACCHMGRGYQYPSETLKRLTVLVDAGRRRGGVAPELVSPRDANPC